MGKLPSAQPIISPRCTDSYNCEGSFRMSSQSVATPNSVLGWWPNLAAALGA